MEWATELLKITIIQCAVLFFCFFVVVFLFCFFFRCKVFSAILHLAEWMQLINHPCLLNVCWIVNLILESCIHLNPEETKSKVCSTLLGLFTENAILGNWSLIDTIGSLVLHYRKMPDKLPKRRKSEFKLSWKLVLLIDLQ